MAFAGYLERHLAQRRLFIERNEVAIAGPQTPQVEVDARRLSRGVRLRGSDPEPLQETGHRLSATKPCRQLDAVHRNLRPREGRHGGPRRAIAQRRRQGIGRGSLTQKTPRLDVKEESGQDETSNEGDSDGRRESHARRRADRLA